MRKSIILLAITCLIGCQQAPNPNNVNVETLLTVKYLGQEFGDTMKVTITEKHTTAMRMFSEKYVIPVRPVWDIDDIGFDTYIDDFCYIEGAGLFRIIGSDNSYYAGDVLGHFKDLIWIEEFLFTKRAQSEFVVTTYHDRRFDIYNDVLKESHFGGPLNVIHISVTSSEFSNQFQDTLVTFMFKDASSSHEKVEFKTYDSKLNLVKYAYQHVDGSLSIFLITPSDYKKLKIFRQKLNSFW